MDTKDYNTTQLHPDKSLERHIFHRDQFAHMLRWFYVAKEMQPGDRVLDYGCGNANALKLYYHNMRVPSLYVGVDIRAQTIESLKASNYGKLQFAKFHALDLCAPLPQDFVYEPFTVITCFEVIEHIGHANAPQFLQNMKQCLAENGRVYLSTPNYDPKVGHAKNHDLNGEIGEWDHKELEAMLGRYFVIEKKIGTFASQKDYKPMLNDWQTKMFDSLSTFFDSTMMSVVMAPLFPEQSRNTVWVLKHGNGNN